MKTNITSFWGRDAGLLVKKLPKGTKYYKSSAYVTVVNMSIGELRKLCKNNWTVVFSSAEHDKETFAIVTLKHPKLEKEVTYEESFHVGYPEESVHYMYEEGNYSCDCNRSIFINEHIEEEIDELNCGDTIKLVNLRVEYRPFKWSVI